MTTRSVLLAVGGPVELVGLGLISLDIIAPTVRAGARAVVARRDWLLEWFRQLLATMRGDVTVAVPPAVARAGGVGPTAVVGPTAHASIEQRVDLLFEVVAGVQARLDRNEAVVAEHGAELRRSVSQLRGEVEKALEDAIRESEGAYLRWRGLGFAIALTGATLVYIAAFV